MTPESPATHSLRTFVRNAWVLLVFQLIAAAGAVGITAWATLQVRPLLAQRDQLKREIADAMGRVETLSVQENALKESIKTLGDELKGARQATPVLTEAINAFHRKQYAEAITKYDEALRLNPGDAYIHNLKSYSQFKAGDLAGAARTLSRALQIDPTYDWGYFDLARYQCGAGSPDEALRTITGALKTRGDSVRRRIDFFLTKDGEFTTLCRDIRGDLRKLAAAP
jgi:tetratricopeptide (TPR) repeat protein